MTQTRRSPGDDSRASTEQQQADASMVPPAADNPCTLTIGEAAELLALSWSAGYHSHRFALREAVENDCVPFDERVDQYVRLLGSRSREVARAAS